MLLGRLWALQVHPLTDRKPTENRQKRVLARCPVSVGFLSVLGFLFVSISAPLGPFGVFWMLLGRLWALQVHPLTDRKPTENRQKRVLARCPVSVGFLSVLGFLFVSISAPLGPFGVFWMLLGRLWALQVHPLTDRKPTENRQKRVLARCPVSVGFLSVLGFLFVSISAPLDPNR